MLNHVATAVILRKQRLVRSEYLFKVASDKLGTRKPEATLELDISLLVYRVINSRR